MRRTKYAVVLSEAQRAYLRTLIGQGTAPARKLTRARILLKADQIDSGPAWVTARNAATFRIDWQFTTHDARTKLRRLYPAYEA